MSLLKTLPAVFAVVLSALQASDRTAIAENRVALVIGNGAYKNAPALPNPPNDARDVAATLQRIGFETIFGVDLDQVGMQDATIRFSRAARRADVAMIYYSGHAMQYAGINYLMPIDAKLTDEADLRRFARVDDIVADLQQAKNLRILILDSCRNNPFAEELKRSISVTRAASLQRGLAKIDAPLGMIIAYSTQAGQTAEDGTGRNSPYTRSFLKHIETAAEIGTIFRRISADVYESTKTQQLPELSLSLIGEFYFQRPQPAAIPTLPTVSSPPVLGMSPDEVFWFTIKDTRIPAFFEEFIKRFPSSAHVPEARARLYELNKRVVAADRPPSAPSPPALQSPPKAPPPVQGEAVAAPARPQAPTSHGQEASVAPPARLSLPCGSASTVSLIQPRRAALLSASEECSLKPKDVFKECDVCPEMVVIPKGSFVMGSPETEQQGELQHRVTIEKPFAVGRFSVTFDEWDACVSDNGCNRYRPRDRGWGRGRRPVIYVSWNDTKNYLAWISRKTGKTYRLLTEAEREYVTRAGTVTPFWFGSSISTNQANYNGNYAYGNGPKGEFRQATVPVDSFAPNPWGLFQVHGNVWEWMEDCSNDSYDGAPTDGSAWLQGDCSARVHRGGSWFGSPVYLRSATRGGEVATVRHYMLGFRIARSLSQ